MRRALKFFALAVLILFLVALTIAVFLLYRETETSAYQARELAQLANELNWEVKNGPNGDPYFPQAGPYDVRMGYSRLPELLHNLVMHGFHVQAQARVSATHEGTCRGGLVCSLSREIPGWPGNYWRWGSAIVSCYVPGRVYENFESVPSLVTDSLLFIENRELLDPTHLKKNPAIEWDRLGRAVLDKIIQFFRAEHDVVGGSTLATQIEKYRHSPNGMTITPRDKVQQVASASVRAYLDGEETLPARKRIVVDYLNTVPLSAAAGFGEANGLGDGLWAWYGLDFDETNHILNSRFVEGDALVEAARLYKHVLSLMIAQRRPSYYLLAGREALEELTNSHLRVLCSGWRDSARPRGRCAENTITFSWYCRARGNQEFCRPKGRQCRAHASCFPAWVAAYV